jgi:hypothetical protein
MQTRTTGTRRPAAIALFLIALAAASFTFGGARPAAAQVQTSADRYLVMDVPNQVIDDLVAVQRATKEPEWPIEPQLDLTYKLCGDFQCICINIDPCEPDSAPARGDRISLASSLGTPAVLELVVRELKSGKYSAVKLCSTLQSLHVGCVTASLPQK